MVDVGSGGKSTNEVNEGTLGERGGFEVTVEGSDGPDSREVIAEGEEGKSEGTKIREGCNAEASTGVEAEPSNSTSGGELTISSKASNIESETSSKSDK